MSEHLKSLGIIGLGRMGRCLVKGLGESGTLKRENIFFTTKHAETAEAVEKQLGIKKCKSNQELVQKCDTIVVAVKPQVIDDVLTEISEDMKKGTTLISIVASTSTEQIESKLKTQVGVVRTMPNTPVFVQAAMTAACKGKHASEKDLAKAEAIFKPLGRFVVVDEAYLNAVTGLSGCGPAYVYVLLESLIEAGIKVGLPRELAVELSGQTVLGAAKMLLETGRHPAALKDEVTTPSGCTIEGLLALEEGKFRVTLIKAVVQATERAKTLSKNSKN